MYERHDPAFQALHRVVRENLATFYAAIEQGWQSGLPAFVRAEFSRYLDCGVLERGFAHLACQDCGLPRLVAFTCAGRGFCPTCLGRRMNQTTLNLLAHVLPAQPLRQWVLTVPFPLRAPLAYEPGLMALVARVLEDSLLRWYRQRLAPEDPTAQGGLLTVIQRSSGDMRLNPHLHVVALDGCAFRRGPLAAPDHSACLARPVCKHRPGATPKHPGATGVHQAVQASTFGYKMSLHQVVRAFAPDLRFDRGQVSCVRGRHEAASTRP